MTSAPRLMTCLQGASFGETDLGEEIADFGEHWEQLHLVHEAGGHLGLDEGADTVGYVVEGVGFECQLHAAQAAELVHQDGRAGVAFDVFEEEGRASCFCGAAVEFGGAVGDLGHLEVRVNFDGDALELAGFL